MTQLAQSRRLCGTLRAAAGLAFGGATDPRGLTSRPGAELPRSSAVCALPRPFLFFAAAPARASATSAAVGGLQGVEQGRGNGPTPGISKIDNCSCVPRSASSMPPLHRFNEIESRKERCRDGGNFIQDRGKFSRICG